MAQQNSFTVNQRVRVKATNGGHRPPPDTAKGATGTILPQIISEWAGTRLAVEPGVPQIYYVEIDEGAIEIIGEDWLEPL